MKKDERVGRLSVGRRGTEKIEKPRDISESKGDGGNVKKKSKKRTISDRRPLLASNASTYQRYSECNASAKGTFVRAREHYMPSLGRDRVATTRIDSRSFFPRILSGKEKEHLAEKRKNGRNASVKLRRTRGTRTVKIRMNALVDPITLTYTLIFVIRFEEFPREATSIAIRIYVCIYSRKFRFLFFSQRTRFASSREKTWHRFHAPTVR